MSLRMMTLRPEVAVPNTYLGDIHTFAEDGVAIPNGLHLIDSSIADFRTRPALTFRNRMPVYDKKINDYSKDKKSVTLTIPVPLNNGKMSFQTLRIEREVHPDAQAAAGFVSLSNLINTYGVQILLSDDTEAFWTTGSLVIGTP